MATSFDIHPAHAYAPFIRAHGEGVVFSAVLRGNGPRMLQLIHAKSGETLDIPLGDAYRVGHVYSVCIAPFDDREWLYRYRVGNRWVQDPCARGLQKVGLGGDLSEKGQVLASTCAPLRDEALVFGGPEKPLPPADWSAQLVYGLHVRGFTAGLAGDLAGACQDESCLDGAGAFAALEAKLPYLEDLGVTAVELMPVYRPLASRRNKNSFKTMQDALRAWPVGPQGDPMRDMKERPNYWGFGRGLYYALRPAYGSQASFAHMVRAFHARGLRVLLQVYFEKGIHVPEQIDVLRYYVRRFGIDGFRLMGHLPAPVAIAFDPSLADIALFFRDFPFEEMEEADGTDGTDGPGWMDGHPRILTCGDGFQTLLRRFVKSDDHVLRDFLRTFLAVPQGCGEIRFVTDYEGFTLADLVSYSERHNEANGEFGLDGRADNYSWNCGEEGPSEDPQVLALRRRQIRNFLALLLLSQGTPRLWQGDERMQTQGGNNNPYCQDNEISWLDWSEGAAGPALFGPDDRERLLSFVRRLASFRRDHPVFRSQKPFQYIDYLGIGHPDVSMHGAEAWKPDLGSFSHSIGLAFCENYARQAGREEARAASQGRRRGERAGRRGAAGADAGTRIHFFRMGASRQLPAFTYLAINMYWKDLSLALPKLPPYFVWKVVADTAVEEGFLPTPTAPPDQHLVEVGPRSIKLLCAFPDIESVYRQRRAERRQSLPAAGACRRAAKAKTPQARALRRLGRGARRILGLR